MKKITLLASALVISILSTNLKAQNGETVDVISPNVVTEAIPQIATPRAAESTLLFDNGPHFNITGSPNLSILEDTTLGLSMFGHSASTPVNFTIADDFTLSTGSDIESVDLYAYQTGAPTTPATINTVFIQIWDGNPSNPESTVVWGDLATNLFEIAEFSGTFRVDEGDQANTSRAIYRITALTSGLFLQTGTHWIEWQYEGNTSFGGPFQPPVTGALGELPSGNALQSFAGDFGPALDGAVDGVIYDFPFQIYGEENLSVDDNQLNTQITLSPNPATESISVTNNAASNLSRIEIYNIDGKLLGNTRVNVTSTTVDISSLAKGIYLVKIYTDQGIVTKKLLKA